MKISLKVSVNGVLNGGDLSSFRTFMKKKDPNWGKHNGEDANNILVPQAVFADNKVIPMISRDCFLSFVFESSVFNDAAEMVFNGMRMLTPELLSRGYLLPISGAGAMKKTSAIKIPHLLSETHLEPADLSLRVGSQQGHRNSNSLRYEVVLPTLTYATNLYVDLDDLSFISTDGLFDRAAMTEDLIKIPQVRDFFRETYGVELPEPKFYVKTSTPTEVAEQGILLPKTVTKKLLTFILESFANAQIRKSKAVGEITELKASLKGESFDLMNDASRAAFIELAVDSYRPRYKEAAPAQIEAATLAVKTSKNPKNENTEESENKTMKKKSKKKDVESNEVIVDEEGA